MSDIVSSTTGSFKYTGKIQAKLLSENKILKQIDVHNNGRGSLFKILCAFLADEARIQQQIPKYIALFEREGDTSGGNGLWDTNVLLSRITNFFPISARISLNNNNNKYSCVYEATIPTALIRGKHISAFALYNSKDALASLDAAAMAYHIIADDANDLTIDRVGYANSLLVQWELSFENSTT